MLMLQVRTLCPPSVPGMLSVHAGSSPGLPIEGIADFSQAPHHQLRERLVESIAGSDGWIVRISEFALDHQRAANDRPRCVVMHVLPAGVLGLMPPPGRSATRERGVHGERRSLSPSTGCVHWAGAALDRPDRRAMPYHPPLALATPGIPFSVAASAGEKGMGTGCCTASLKKGEKKSSSAHYTVATTHEKESCTQITAASGPPPSPASSRRQQQAAAHPTIAWT